jgi:hypothetical protein
MEIKFRANWVFFNHNGKKCRRSVDGTLDDDALTKLAMEQLKMTINCWDGELEKDESFEDVVFEKITL